MDFKEHGWHRIDQLFEMTSSTDMQDREMLVIYENLDNIPQTTTWWRKVLCGKDYHV